MKKQQWSRWTILLPGKADKIRFPVFPEDATANESRRARSAQRIVRRSDGRHHRPPLSPPRPALRRRSRRVGDGVFAARAARVAQDPVAGRSQRRAGPIAVQIAGADPADAGRCSAPQRRRGRADHRHQHGLPGEESLQRRGRLCAAGGRSAGRAHPRGRGDGGRSAGDAQDPHRPGPERAQRACDRAHRGGRGRPALAIHGRTRACAFAATPNTTPSPR